MTPALDAFCSERVAAFPVVSRQECHLTSRPRTLRHLENPTGHPPRAPTTRIGAGRLTVKYDFKLNASLRPTFGRQVSENRHKYLPWYEYLRWLGLMAAPPMGRAEKSDRSVMTVMRHPTRGICDARAPTRAGCLVSPTERRRRAFMTIRRIRKDQSSGTWSYS